MPMKIIFRSPGVVFLVTLACLLGCSVAGPWRSDGRTQPFPPAWEEVAPGVWKAEINDREEVTLLDPSSNEPRLSALAAMDGTEFPLPASEIEACVVDGNTFLKFPLEEGEQIYGLGLNFKTVEQRGRILRLHVDHFGGKDDGRTHAPVPFYVSSKGYGVLVDSARYIDVYVGTAVRKDSPVHPEPRDRNTDRAWSARPRSDSVEMLIPSEGVELYAFGGPDMLRAVQRFNLYCGGGCLPPKWGLGFWQRTPTLFSERDVMSEVSAFEEKGFPLDVIGLEPGWQSKAYPCTYEWDSGRFPDAVDFVDTLGHKGIKVNLWINPYVSPHSSLFEPLKPYMGSHTVWLGPVPDYVMDSARSILLDHFERHHMGLGVSGYKIDETDGYDFWLWPDTAVFPSGLTGEVMRQTYGLTFQRMIHDAFRENNKRTYGLTRASNAGSAPLPFVLYNDYYSHRDFITALINSGFCGLLWTPEVRKSGSGEEWLRRMQSVCFSPMAMINAWADGTKPWSFPEVYESVRDIALLRMRLLPYLYTAFARYHFEGIPPIRAMALEEGFTAVADVKSRRKALKDQFMVGDSLLVAPLFAGEEERSVVLPRGKWYDFYTGRYVGNGEVITVRPGLKKIPLFVKDGGIIPFMPAVKNTGELRGEIPLTVRHYGEAAGRFLLYDDDGETFDYEKGEFTWIALEVRRNPDGALEGSVEKPAEGYDSPFGVAQWKFMTR